MLSIKKLKTGCEHYYVGLQVEDYYLKGGEPPGTLVGIYAGPVTRPLLRSLLLGFDPETGDGLVQNAGSKGRIPGYDLTVSAPKSVSVAAALAPPELRDQIREAHSQSVVHMLGVAEAIAGRSRMGKAGRRVVPARLTFAIFEHGTARRVDNHLPDPQLHTHCVAPNVALRPDGSTGAFVSKCFYEHQLLLTSIYRYQLAQRLGKLGFDVLPLDKQRGFRLTCIPIELERQFSKRRKEIKRELARQGVSGPAASEKAALATRLSKVKPPPRIELLANWKAQADALGHEIHWPGSEPEDTQPRRDQPTPNQRRLISAMIKREANLLSEYKPHFDREELLCRAYDKAIGDPMSTTDVAWAVNSFLNGPAVVRITDENGREFYRTSAAQKSRRQLREVLQREAGDRAGRVLCLRSDSTRWAASYEIARSLRREGTHVVLVTRSKRGAEALARESRRERDDETKVRGSEVEATTLSKFQSNLDRGHFHRGPLPPAWLRDAARALGAITERANRYLAWSSDRRPLEIGRRSVVLVDEAHKLTASEISALIDATHRHGARVVFLGREQGVYGDVALPRLRPRPEQELPRALADSLKREPEPEVS